MCLRVGHGRMSDIGIGPHTMRRGMRGQHIGIGHVTLSENTLWQAIISSLTAISKTSVDALMLAMNCDESIDG
jgi:hypothetical protein